jgi:DNA topoisomerase VI subunit B
MGCDVSLWPRACVKELVDNSIDACEEAGIDPEIGVDIDPDSVTILVSDNGPGIPAETATLLCDRTLRTSTRQAYAGIDRGCQGNFLQTGMCLPLGAGGDDTTVRISSRGILHTIELGCGLNQIHQVTNMAMLTAAA